MTPPNPADDPQATQPLRRRSEQSLSVPSVSEETLPRQFGEYELIERLAQGGMGVVYLARQSRLNRPVAIKMILAGHSATESEVKRFYIEAEAAGSIDHPGIVPVFDIGCREGTHYYSMRYVEGDSLSQKIKAGPLPPRLAAKYVQKIAEAIHVAHKNGIIHRDLKPGNVLLDKNDNPRITDFGLARLTQFSSELTTTGMVVGTPSYMPPEQASGKTDQINASVDIYSLGAILYASLTGRAPFEASTPTETLMHVLQEEPKGPRQIDRTIPKDLEVICLKCLEKDPADRYRSAAELGDDLTRFLAGEPIRARNDITRRLRKWLIREPVLAAHLAATVLMGVVILINYWLFGRGNLHSWWLLWANLSMMTVWAAFVFLLQKIQNVLNTQYVVPLTWAAINPMFLTFMLGVNDEPRGSLLSLYLLLMITSCFFRRIGLVVVTWVSCLVGYTILLMVFFHSETLSTPSSYLVVFGMTLVVSGILLTVLSQRLKQLSQQSITHYH